MLLLLISLVAFTGVSSNVADYDCFERADTGVGRLYIPAFAWNPRTSKCENFVYGGMFGNRNRFSTAVQCLSACRTAVLTRQLTFNPSEVYTFVNRLYENVKLTVKVEPIEDNYFKLVFADSQQALSFESINQNNQVLAETFTDDEKQKWDLIPTGEQNVYRIKAESLESGGLDRFFLEAAPAEPLHVALKARDSTSLAQQWIIA